MTAPKYEGGKSYYLKFTPEELAEIKKHILAERKKRANRNPTRSTMSEAELARLAELNDGDTSKLFESLVKLDQKLRADPVKAASLLVAEFGKTVSKKGMH